MSTADAGTPVVVQLNVFGDSVAVESAGPPGEDGPGADDGVQLALSVDVPMVRDMRRGRGVAVQDTLAQAE